MKNGRRSQIKLININEMEINNIIYFKNSTGDDDSIKLLCSTINGIANIDCSFHFKDE